MPSMIGRLKTHLPLPLLDALRRLPIARSQRVLARLHETTTELEACLRTEQFPDLPPRERRVDLMTLMVGTGAAQAMYMLHSLYRTEGVPGAVCEFGVAQGRTSALLANELLKNDRELWLFDTFRGLPAPTEEDILLDDIFELKSMGNYEGTMAFGSSAAQQRVIDTGFEPARLHIVEGAIEQLRPEQLPDTICFAYIDCDLYRPTAAALARVHDRMPEDGRIVIDDYGFFSSGPQRAVDEFVAANRAYRLIHPQPYAGKFVILVKGDR